ncbi:single-stranded DNA-binding protein [Brevibacterium sp. 50QC2O2]|uniref:single-stranded DNA-binding protein n=1 Tax=Brevibacterium TaxID=1696 RepID=UPI00211CF695|nr:MULTISPECIES: single-stranded DNA-binding protein [unclassified Brevibacterium]MCQ9384818.1 single-stranded DNA-binding protein [Brevibacterium sp. 68QC2CO]MCQ9387583.1 single-stranded DNA-binding protein [Brevibacterium sp. 50QC2O2]
MNTKMLNHFIGHVGGPPTAGQDREDRPWVRFRLAVGHSWFDRESGQWKNSDPTWFDVSCNGMLADNVRKSIDKGDPVIVLGRVTDREWKDAAGNVRNSLVIIAEAVGLNLQFGRGAITTRSKQQRGEEERDARLEADTAPGSDGQDTNAWSMRPPPDQAEQRADSEPAGFGAGQTGSYTQAVGAATTPRTTVSTHVDAAVGDDDAPF